MPKQSGLIKLDGTFGDINFYKRDGQHFARTKGGIKGERIKNDPKFVRTRENMAEFAHVGTVGKLFRRSIRPLIEKAKDSKVSIRLTGKMREIMKTDMVSNRGSRNIANGEIMFLKGFEFNKNGELNNTLFAKTESLIDLGSRSVEMSCSIIPVNDLRTPQGATHFKLTIAGLAMNMQNPEEYELLTDAIDIKAIDNDQLNLNLSVSFTGNLAGRIVFQFIMIEFFQEVNGKFYILKNGTFNCLQLANIQP